MQPEMNVDLPKSLKQKQSDFKQITTIKGLNCIILNVLPDIWEPCALIRAKDQTS